LMVPLEPALAVLGQMVPIELTIGRYGTIYPIV